MTDYKKDILNCIFEGRDSIDVMLEASDTQVDRIDLLRTLADLAEEGYITLRFDGVVKITQKGKDEILPY